MTIRISPAGLSFLALTLSATSPSDTQVQVPMDLTPVELAGNVHPAIAAGKVLGPVDRAAPMEKMILSLKLSPEAQQRRRDLLRDQLDPASPRYHRWLTPQQHGELFGPAPGDLALVLGWLKGQGFRIDEVTPGWNAIVFSGTAGAVMDAFRTPLATVEVDGVVRQGNLTNPSIPRALVDLVNGVVSLHNLPSRAMNTGARRLGPIHAHGVIPKYTSSTGSHSMGPGDFATIYNTAPLLAKGVDGTGMTIAIAGRTDILRSDVEDFRTFFGLPPNKLAITYNGSNPGIINSDEEAEADLDVEWAGAVAPNATVEFVVTPSTTTGDGVNLSLLYIVSNNIAPVASASFGISEQGLGSSGVAFFNSLYAQAASQGQTFFISSGDAGAAGADSGGEDYGYYGVAINGMGSSPDNVCVGGTQFHEGTGTYWSATNGADNSSALGYIPEAAWNESANASGGYGLWSTGGGYSIYNSQPWWQSALAPSATFRAVPDVALTAAFHDGYVVAQEGDLEKVAGTSASSPSFAGLMALVVQATGQRQGNANPVLYQLGYNQYNASGPAVFHDVTSGNNSVPGVTGFDAAPGYDACTGLGSVDANALVANWIKAGGNHVTARIVSPASSLVAFTGSGTQAFKATGTDSDPSEILTFTWTFGDGTMATGAAVTHTYTTGSTASSYPVTLTVSDSTGNLAADTRTVRVASTDVNHDGAQTLQDLLQWSVDFTTQNLEGDLNNDGQVNDADLLILLGAL